MAKKNLLLVDDDPKGLRVLEVSLRNAGFSVTTATNGAEALSKIHAVQPMLVLSDTDMPVIDGYELCQKLKKSDRLRDIPFLFLSADRSVESKVRGLELGADDYLTRPVYIKEVLTRVRMALQRRERERLLAGTQRRFFGALEDIGVVDLIQTVEQGARDAVVTLDANGRRGELWFQGGRVIDAISGTTAGDDAVYRMLTWDDGTFEINFQTVDRTQTVRAEPETLLMEGMHHVDEWARMCEQLPTLSTTFQVDYTELAERLAELPDEVNALLRLFNGERSVLDVVYDAQISDPNALSAVSRLYFEGIIFESTGAHTLPAPEPPPPEKANLDDWLAAPAPQAPAELPPPRDHRPASPQIPTMPTPTPSSGFEPPPPNFSDDPAGLERDLVDDLLRSAADDPDDFGGTGAFAVDDAMEFPSPAEVESGGEYTQPPAEAHTEPSPVVHDHAHEGEFFDGADALEEQPFEDAASPLSPAAYVAFAMVALVIAAGAYFGLRDTVDPRPETADALQTGWHSKRLSARPPVGTQPPIEGEWTLAVPKQTPQPSAEGTPTGPHPTSDKVGATPPSRPAPAKPAAQQAAYKTLMAEGAMQSADEDFRAAAATFEKALALSPDDEATLIAYANALLESGRDAEALTTAEKARRLNPKNARAHLIIGSIRQNQGKKEAAIESYEQYLALVPDGHDAPDVRRVLEGLH